MTFYDYNPTYPCLLYKFESDRYKRNGIAGVDYPFTNFIDCKRAAVHQIQEEIEQLKYQLARVRSIQKTKHIDVEVDLWRE